VSKIILLKIIKIGFQVTVENVGDTFLRHSVFIQPQKNNRPI